MNFESIAGGGAVAVDIRCTPVYKIVYSISQAATD